MLPATAAPATGERFEAVLEHRNVAIRQILSGRTDAPQEFLQEDDEWVVVLSGAAVMTVNGERLPLGPGDWAFLPAGVPHTVLDTAAGTSWLAVHVRPGLQQPPAPSPR